MVPAGTVRQLVADRRNLLITGSGGSGKTTALGALLGLADPSDRIVTIEDVAELRVDHPHVVTLDSPDSGPVKSPAKRSARSIPSSTSSASGLRAASPRSGGSRSTLVTVDVVGKPGVSGVSGVSEGSGSSRHRA